MDTHPEFWASSLSNTFRNVAFWFGNSVENFVYIYILNASRQLKEELVFL